MFQKIKQISKHNLGGFFLNRKFPIKMISSPNFHILGWCPAGPVLLHVEKVPLQPSLVDHPSSDGVLIKMLYEVDLFNCPTLHPIFSHWIA